MWLLRRGSDPWKNKSVYIVDGLRVTVSFTLADPDVVNTITALPSIWLSLGTSGDRAKKRWVGNGPGSVASGLQLTPSTSEFTGKGLEAVSPNGAGTSRGAHEKLL